MKDKARNIVVSILFLVLIITIFFLNCFIKDKEVSISERRKLSKFPKITINKILDGKFSNELETYAMDQFVGRDFFRNIKANVNFKILKKKDNNEYFIKDDVIYKQLGILKENEVRKVAAKIKNIKEKYLKNNKVYYSIIPDKTYYVEDNELKTDYKKLEEIMKEELKDITYINLFDILNKDDYYKTDTHWKQENILKVAKKISKEMTNDFNLNNIEIMNKGKFNGVYLGQIGLNIKQKDELKYIINPTIQNCTTYNFETKKQNKIYDEEKWKKSNDKYDYFVSGATPLIEIINSNSSKEKELIIFRDSFGSSLAPLLIEEYSKITLVDIRYMSSNYLNKYIKFDNQDILFLYSTLVLNEASILK